MAKGGTEHKQAQIILRDYYKRLGKIAIIEGFLDGKHIDLLVYDQSTGKTTAVEYQTGLANALRNIFVDSQLCHEVVIVSSKQTVIDSIKIKAKKTFDCGQLKRLEFRILKYFIPHERKETTTNIAEYNQPE